MLYMVVETFRNGKVKLIYERLEAKGRMMPDGLIYINSWISEDFSKCFQVMESESLELLYEWISHWDDLMSFEIIPVITSTEAKKKTLG